MQLLLQEVYLLANNPASLALDKIHSPVRLYQEPTFLEMLKSNNPKDQVNGHEKLSDRASTGMSQLCLLKMYLTNCNLLVVHVSTFGVRTFLEGLTSNSSNVRHKYAKALPQLIAHGM
jgi:hypothetical protein